MKKENKNLIDTKEDITIKIVPCKIQNILSYEVLTLMYKPFDAIPVETMSIHQIIEKMLDNYFDFAGSSNIIDNNRQIITVLVPQTNEVLIQDEIWDYVNKINFVPTLAYNGRYYDCPELTEEETFVFTYILNQPIQDKKVIKNIERYLKENIFADYKVTITANIGTGGTFTELYVNNNIYVPVVGGIADVKE